MCKFKNKEFYDKTVNAGLRKQLESLKAGCVVIVKWYDRRARKIRYLEGLLLAKRNKGASSNIIIRRTVIKSVMTYLFYVYCPTFLGLLQLSEAEQFSTAAKAKYYQAALKPIRWKYL